MSPTWAAAAYTLLAIATPLRVLAGPALVPRWVVDDWVSVDESAQPHTLHPVVTTQNGNVKTISGAPYMVTGTVFVYTSASTVQTSTATLQPPPTATASSGAGGVFAVCNNKEGADSPFCQPKAGSSLSLGKTYYVTWDPTYFANPNTLVMVSAYYVPSTIPLFNSVRVVASRGYYPFYVDEFYLQGRQSNALRFTLTYIVTDGPDAGLEKRLIGPSINAVRADIRAGQPPPPPPTGLSPGAIAGVVIGTLGGLAIVVLGLFCCWRKNRDNLVMGAIRRRSSQGYAAKSRAQRIADERGAHGKTGIQLDESPTSPTMPSPTKGQNVFREEIRRQETARQ